jgi:hypothetical protein
MARCVCVGRGGGEGGASQAQARVYDAKYLVPTYIAFRCDASRAAGALGTNSLFTTYIAPNGTSGALLQSVVVNFPSDVSINTITYLFTFKVRHGEGQQWPSTGPVLVVATATGLCSKLHVACHLKFNLNDGGLSSTTYLLVRTLHNAVNDALESLGDFLL